MFIEIGGMRCDPVGVVYCILMMCYKYLNPLGSANQLSFAAIL